MPDDSRQTRQTERSIGVLLIPAVVLVLGGALSVYLQIDTFAAAADDRDWRASAEFVRQQLDEGDAVRVHPWWNEEPLPHLESVGRQVLRQREPTPGDLQGVRRVWTLAESTHRASAHDRLPFDPSRQWSRQFGDVTVFRTRVPSSLQYSWSFMDHLDEARVERIHPDGSERRCSNWSESDRRWDCGGRSNWLYVGEELHFLDHDPHRCIWAHPLPDGKTLRVTFPDVPVTDHLRLRAGLTFKGSRTPPDKAVPITYRLLIDGETRIDDATPAETSSWRLHRVATSELAGQRVPVALEVEAPRIKNRFFCFDAWAE